MDGVGTLDDGVGTLAGGGGRYLGWGMGRYLGGGRYLGWGVGTLEGVGTLAGGRYPGRGVGTLDGGVGTLGYPLPPGVDRQMDRHESKHNLPVVLRTRSVITQNFQQRFTRES